MGLTILNPCKCGLATPRQNQEYTYMATIQADLCKYILTIDYTLKPFINKIQYFLSLWKNLVAMAFAESKAKASIYLQPMNCNIQYQINKMSLSRLKQLNEREANGKHIPH